MKKNKTYTFKQDGYIKHAGFRINKRETANGASYVVALGQIDGKQARKQFQTLIEAKTFAEVKAVEKKNHGLEALRMDEPIRREALEAIRILKGTDASLIDAAKEYVRLHAPPDDAIKTGELVRLFLKWMKTTPTKINKGIPGGYRVATIKDAEKKLFAFQHDFKQRAAVTITTADIEAWLNEQKFSPIPWGNHKRNISMLFSWAAKKENPLAGMANPCRGIETPNEAHSLPAIFTPKETQAVFAWLESGHTRELPFFAVCFFAGIRPDEALRLSWDAVDFKNHEILIKAEQSKTHRDRLITMTTNLEKWLAMYAGAGKIAPSQSTITRTRQQMCKEAGLQWGKDIARHSFATYYAAIHGMNEAADQLGHETTKMLHKHYKSLIKNRKAQAGKYFDIEPAGAQDKIIRMQGA